MRESLLNPQGGLRRLRLVVCLVGTIFAALAYSSRAQEGGAPPLPPVPPTGAAGHSAGVPLSPHPPFPNVTASNGSPSEAQPKVQMHDRGPSATQSRKNEFLRRIMATSLTPTGLATPSTTGAEAPGRTARIRVGLNARCT